jgi:hypothetical protein
MQVSIQRKATVTLAAVAASVLLATLGAGVAWAINVDPGALAGLAGAARRGSGPPYVFVDRRPVGDMGTVRALVGSGQFEHLLRGNL